MFLVPSRLEQNPRKTYVGFSSKCKRKTLFADPYQLPTYCHGFQARAARSQLCCDFVPHASFCPWRVAYVWHEFAEKPFDYICYHCFLQSSIPRSPVDVCLRRQWGNMLYLPVKPLREHHHLPNHLSSTTSLSGSSTRQSFEILARCALSWI